MILVVTWAPPGEGLTYYFASRGEKYIFYKLPIECQHKNPWVKTGLYEWAWEFLLFKVGSPNMVALAKTYLGPWIDALLFGMGPTHITKVTWI